MYFADIIFSRAAVAASVAARAMVPRLLVRGVARMDVCDCVRMVCFAGVAVRAVVARGAMFVPLRAVTLGFFVSVDVLRSVPDITLPERLPTLRSRSELFVCGVTFVERETVFALCEFFRGEFSVFLRVFVTVLVVPRRVAARAISVASSAVALCRKPSGAKNNDKNRKIPFIPVYEMLAKKRGAGQVENNFFVMKMPTKMSAFFHYSAVVDLLSIRPNFVM